MLNSHIESGIRSLRPWVIMVSWPQEHLRPRKLMTDPRVSQLGKSKSNFKATPPLVLYLNVVLIQISWIRTRRPDFLLKLFLNYFKKPASKSSTSVNDVCAAESGKWPWLSTVHLEKKRRLGRKVSRWADTRWSQLWHLSSSHRRICFRIILTVGGSYHLRIDVGAEHSTGSFLLAFVN